MLKKLHWTRHALSKMRHWRLSEGRVRRVINSPRRVEYGIAPDTIAMMQPTSMRRTERGKEDWKTEIWVLLDEREKERRVVSAWRYPGKTKEGEGLPREIMQEITSAL